MASNDFRGVIKKETRVANRHDVDILIPIRFIFGLRSKSFLHTHHNECPGLPTSWKVRISYNQDPDKKYVDCQLSLQRTDNGNDDVDVSATVSFLNDDDVEVISPKWLFSRRMLSGEVSTEKIKIDKFPGYRNHIFFLGLVLKMSISIRYCHSAVVVYAKPCQDKLNKILQSKL